MALVGLAKEYLESRASNRPMKQGTADLDQVEAVSLIWTHSWYDEFEIWGLGKWVELVGLRAIVVRVKEDVKLEGEKETAETLLTPALSAILNSAIMKPSLCHPVCATSQQYFGTLIHAGHRCCSDAAEGHGVIPASLLGGLVSLHSANIPRSESVSSFRTWGVKEETML